MTACKSSGVVFPYFFVGTFIEGPRRARLRKRASGFPYFFVGTFIEGLTECMHYINFVPISLLFRRDFH